MADRGPNQDTMRLLDPNAEPDAKYRDASYLGDNEADDEEIQDLGFIVEDHDDRRTTLADGWQRLDDLDTDEPLGTNRGGAIPHAVVLKAQGASPDRFATDYHVAHAAGEEQEEDFVETSMLNPDPDMNDGIGDFTDETLEGVHGEALATDLYGHVAGPAVGLGTTLTQDAGLEGFQIRDNPLMQAQGYPASGELLSDEAMGLREVDDLDDEQLEALANGSPLDSERRGM